MTLITLHYILTFAVKYQLNCNVKLVFFALRTVIINHNGKGPKTINVSWSYRFIQGHVIDVRGWKQWHVHHWSFTKVNPIRVSYLLPSLWPWIIERSNFIKPIQWNTLIQDYKTGSLTFRWFHVIIKCKAKEYVPNFNLD